MHNDSDFGCDRLCQWPSVRDWRPWRRQRGGKGNGRKEENRNELREWKEDGERKVRNRWGETQEGVCPASQWTAHMYMSKGFSPSLSPMYRNGPVSPDGSAIIFIWQIEESETEPLKWLWESVSNWTFYGLTLLHINDKQPQYFFIPCPIHPLNFWFKLCDIYVF